MRAVRLVAERTLDVVEIPRPEPRADEVVLDVAACGICGSDLSCYKHGMFAGSILGHELSGTVVASRSPAWPEGSRVVVDPKTPCGTCGECARGAEHRCAAALTNGIGMKLDGGYADAVLAPADLLFAVPDALDLVGAALAEPMAVAIHGVERGWVEPEPAVVFGLGPIGLLTVAALSDRGADPIIGVDPVAERRALAQGLGATVVVEPGDPAIAAAEASLIFETSGVPEAFVEAGYCASPGARVVLVGIPMAAIEVRPMVWVTREITMIGSIAHDTSDWTAALDLLARTPSITNIITERVPLTGVPDAFERLIARADAGKIVTVPSLVV